MIIHFESELLSGFFGRVEIESVFVETDLKPSFSPNKKAIELQTGGACLPSFFKANSNLVESFTKN